MNSLHYLAIAFGVSELVIARRKHSRSSAAPSRSHDGGTLRLLQLGITLSIVGAIVLAATCELGRFTLSSGAGAVALAVFGSGLALRWWSIVVLGRFFTVDVAIRDDHVLVTRGPYRYVRHPSYTGLVVAVIGLLTMFGNWLALAGCASLVVAALVIRIRVEERALAVTFGQRWTSHCSRTWRLLPWLW